MPEAGLDVDSAMLDVASKYAPGEKRPDVVFFYRLSNRDLIWQISMKVVECLQNWLQYSVTHLEEFETGVRVF